MVASQRGITKVCRYNYPSQIENHLSDLLGEIEDILLSGAYILSDRVLGFEEKFADFIGCKYALGVNSGTDALIISLMALNLPPGSEVITHANTFYATVAAILMSGLKPVLVDANPSTYLMNLDQIESAITNKTKVILPVHLYGKPTDMKPILELAEKYHLHIVEDVAQAHGAEIDGKKVGTFGSLGCFSFHPSKNLAAAGDGGAIVCNDLDLYEEIKTRRILGQKEQNKHLVVSLNSSVALLYSWLLVNALSVGAEIS